MSALTQVGLAAAALYVAVCSTVGGWLIGTAVHGRVLARRERKADAAQFVFECEAILFIAERVRATVPPIPSMFLAEKVSDACADQFDMGLEP